jgi:tetratricopeptide (TPR) repeat protein
LPKSNKLGANANAIEGVIHFQLGNIETALLCFDKYLLSEPQHAVTMVNKGITLEHKGLMEAALLWYQKAIDHDDKMINAHIHKGMLLTKLYKYEAAIQSFNIALRIDPQSREALYEKSEALLKLGRYAEVIECCESMCDDQKPPGRALYYCSQSKDSLTKPKDKPEVFCKVRKTPPPYQLVKGLALIELGKNDAKLLEMGKKLLSEIQISEIDVFYVKRARDALEKQVL